jgi:hypothetical protein
MTSSFYINVEAHRGAERLYLTKRIVLAVTLETAQGLQSTRNHSTSSHRYSLSIYVNRLYNSKGLKLCH